MKICSSLWKWVAVSPALCFAALASAQGQDGSRAQRNAQVISALMEGQYNNGNQTYFDKRLKDPISTRHEQMNLVAKRMSTEDGYTSTFDLELKRIDDSGVVMGKQKLVARFSPEIDGWAVRTTFFIVSAKTGIAARELQKLVGCDLLWLEEAGQFHAISEGDNCLADDEVIALLPQEMMLSEEALWLEFRNDARRPFTLERVRNFSCYIDVPGVGGGRETPYQRYKIEAIHDRGDKAYVTLTDGSVMWVSLRNVHWPMNNLDNIFTRHSFVVYAGEKDAESGEEREIAYSWTEPTAQRIGINLKSMLVNCFMLNNEEIKPFYRHEPRL